MAGKLYIVGTPIGNLSDLSPRAVETLGKLTPSAVSTVEVDDLRERLWEVPVGKPVYVICQSGLRSYIACRILAQQGFKCYNLSGGWRLYETVVRDRTAAQEAWPCGMEK